MRKCLLGLGTVLALVLAGCAKDIPDTQSSSTSELKQALGCKTYKRAPRALGPNGHACVDVDQTETDVFKPTKSQRAGFTKSLRTQGQSWITLSDGTIVTSFDTPYLRLLADKINGQFHHSPIPKEFAEGGDGAIEGGDGPAEAPAQSCTNITDNCPLDGGTFTWASTGIQMETEVVENVKQPWGSFDDFCGDGSCGVAHKDDRRFVMRYTVTVPNSYGRVFDPTSCPGQLHVMQGNDEDSLGGVAGEYERSLDEPIPPGSSKYGVEEYYISKDLVGQRIFMDSTCGEDPDNFDASETAYFVATVQ